MTLEIRDLNFSYKDHKVLNGLNLKVSDGEMVALLGKNGAGKTTLMRLIPDFLKCAEGSITIDGVAVRDMGIQNRAAYMAYIPQIARIAFPYPVRTSILMGASSRLSMFQAPTKADEKRVEEIIDLLNLRHIADRNMENISGGERQLVLIARAIMQDARLLILDEPTSFLDYSNQLMVLERIADLVNKGYSCIYSTHNPDLALGHSSRIVVMDDGRISFDGEPEALIGSDVLSKVYGRAIEIVRTERGGIACIPV